MPTPDLYKVETGSTGPSGEKIYDVFSGSEHIADPSDPRLKGTDISKLPSGAAPSGFVSKFNQAPSNVGIDLNIPDTSGGGTTVVDGAGAVREDINKLGGDIKAGLASFGIEPPSSKTSSILDEILKNMQERSASLEERRTADLGSIDKSYSNAIEQTKLSQEEELAKAEGRTRIGGFFTQLEQQDILRMQRQHRLELSALEGKRVSALQDANRAYEDSNYDLAKEHLNTALQIETQAKQAQQQYFSNVIQYSQMSTPLSRANEAVQKKVSAWIEEYPDAFADVDAGDLVDMSLGEAYRRVLKSPSFTGKGKAESFETKTIGKRVIRFGFDKNGNVVSKVDLGASGSEDDEGEIVKKFVGELYKWDLSGTRETFIQSLKLKYPELDPAQIQEYVYYMYPDKYEDIYSNRVK